MRLTVDPTEPGYSDPLRRLITASAVRVFLGGVEQRQCFTADEERGLVIVADCDADGRTQLDASRKRVRRKTLHGVVRIDIPADSPLARSLRAA